MNNQTIFRTGGIAAILGILLLFGGYSIPALIAVGLLLMTFFYFALYKYVGAGSSTLGLAAIGSAVVGAIGLFFTGVNPSISYNIFMGLAFMLPALLGGLAAYGKVGFPRLLALSGIVGGALGILNGIINISGGGDWTNLPSPTLKLLSDLTYYPAFLLVLVWLVWTSILLLRSKATS